MAEQAWLAERFEELWAGPGKGLTCEAGDAVQETWLRLYRSDADTIENAGRWLTSVVGRVPVSRDSGRSSRVEVTRPCY